MRDAGGGGAHVDDVAFELQADPGFPRVRGSPQGARADVGAHGVLVQVGRIVQVDRIGLPDGEPRVGVGPLA